MTLADQLVVMNKGRVEQAGKPLELYEKPQTTFVAGFIGAPPMNLIELPKNGLAGLKLASRPGEGAVILGIRPEHLELAKAWEADALTLDVTLVALEAVGAETYLYGALEGSGKEVIIRVSGKAEFEIGAHLHAKADARHLHFFDVQTGERVA